MQILSGNQRVGCMDAGGLGLRMQRGRIRQPERLKGVRGLDDGAFIQVKVETRAEDEGQGAINTLGYDEFPAARGPDRVDRFREKPPC